MTKAKEPMRVPIQSRETEGEPIICIIYQKSGREWLPFDVRTTFSNYDFESCVNGELIYHESGGGGERKTFDVPHYCGAPDLCAKIWYDRTRVTLTDNGKPITHAEVRKLGSLVIDEPIAGNPFEHPSAQEDGGGTEYCVQCEGYLPSEHTCRHLQYEEGVGYYLGCGSPEVNFSETQTSLYRLLRMLPPKAIDRLLENLMSKKWHSMFHDSMLGGDCTLWIKPKPLDIYCEPFGEERKYEDRYWPGIAWLHSLDSTCKEAMALTAGWVWAYQRQSWKATCVVPDATFIRRLDNDELDEWLALDPTSPSDLNDKPMRVFLNFKPGCANDHQFLKAPSKCHEVILWPKGKLGERALTLSVAEVRRVQKNAVDIYFGAVIERNGKHVSELDGYTITRGFL